MLVSVDVIKPQTCRAEGLELGADLRQHLPAHMGQKKHRGAGPRHIRAKAPMSIDQIRYARSRQNRLRVDQRQMQPNRKSRQSARQLDGGASRRRTDHQTRRREHHFNMRALDGLINLVGEAEIIGRDNKIFQCAISRRSRRKRKNSTPSRRRRFIMLGLTAISPTIAAILLGRK